MDKKRFKENRRNAYLIYVTNVQWWKCDIFKWSHWRFNCGHSCCFCILQGVDEKNIKRNETNHQKKNEPNYFPWLAHIPDQVWPTVQTRFKAKFMKAIIRLFKFNTADISIFRFDFVFHSKLALITSHLLWNNQIRKKTLFCLKIVNFLKNVLKSTFHLM